jgi:metal-responsive CopG/Arc/MetJ family transcriptional regulator
MKTYNVNLDEESVEALDRWLEAAGITRSAYINTLIRKTVDSMDLKKIPDYSKMTMPQLFKMIGAIGGLMYDEKYNDKKK